MFGYDTITQYCMEEIKSSKNSRIKSSKCVQKGQENVVTSRSSFVL